MTKPIINNIFPTPIYTTKMDRGFTKQELNFVKEQKNHCTNNQGNINTKDNYILNRKEFKNIKKFLDKCCEDYLNRIICPKNNVELYITQSWLNKNGKGESHHEHLHPNSMISGVWYPQINEKLPPIQFRNSQQRDITLSIKNYNHFNSATFMLPMRRGELILFPSSLSHSVPRNLSNEERISLSFNTWSKGSLGEIEALTYLPFDRLM